MRTTQSGISVCSFTVAVNRPKKDGQEQPADFFRVTAWRQLGELCNKYLAKGRKVAVVGSVSVSIYNGKDGKTHASILADNAKRQFPFLTPNEEGALRALLEGYEAAVKDCAKFPCSTCANREDGDVCHECKVMSKGGSRTLHDWRDPEPGGEG